MLDVKSIKQDYEDVFLNSPCPKIDQIYSHSNNTNLIGFNCTQFWDGMLQKNVSRIIILGG